MLIDEERLAVEFCYQIFKRMLQLNVSFEDCIKEFGTLGDRFKSSEDIWKTIGKGSKIPIFDMIYISTLVKLDLKINVVDTDPVKAAISKVIEKYKAGRYKFVNDPYLEFDVSIRKFVRWP